MLTPIDQPLDKLEDLTAEETYALLTIDAEPKLMPAVFLQREHER